jgi:uncharacterized membrane protein YbhN (UPF0104 family)
MSATTDDRPPAPEEKMPDALSVRHLMLRLAGLIILLGIIAVAISSIPGLSTIRARFAAASPGLLALIGLLKLGSSLSNILAFRDVFCRRMGWRFSYRLGMAEQATNVLLPTGGAGGLALGIWALRQGGMSTEHITRRSVTFFVLTSLPNFACAGVLGAVLLTGVFGPVPTVPTAVFTALAWVLAAGIATLPRMLRRPGRSDAGALRRRIRGTAHSVGDGITDTGELIRSGRWQAILGSAGYLGFDIAAMIVAFGAFGAVPPVAELAFAYTVGQLGGLIPLPGGIGGTDGGLIGAAVLYGSSLTQATAAVLAYRVFQLGVPAILGTIAFIQLRVSLSRSPAPAIECVGLAEEPRHQSLAPSSAA